MSVIEQVKGLFGKSSATPANAGKGVAMGDAPNNTATPPAASGGNVDIEKLVKDAVAAALGEAIKPLVTRLTETEGNLKIVADTVASQKALGEGQVKALIEADAVARAQQAQQAAQAQQEAEAKKTKRNTFAAEHLKGVPASYHTKLGDDEAKWADEAKAIRQTFADESKAAGIKVPDVGGAAGGEAISGTPANNGGGFLKMPAAAAATA